MPKHRPRRVRVAVCAILAALCAVFLLKPAFALHKESPGAYRITTGASHFHPPTHSWGNYFAFSSANDLVGNGNARREIFIFNLDYYDCFKGTTFPATPCPNPLRPFLWQATNGPGEPDNPSIANPVDTSNPPDGIDDSQWLAFDALGNYNGLTGPSAGYRQIFLKNLITNEVRQATFGIDGDSVRPTLSSEGGLVVFESTAGLTTTPTPAGVSQIYVYETANRFLRQVTNGNGPSTWAMTNKGGGEIVFQSTSNLLGNNADSGVSQVFWAEYDRKVHVAEIHQLTHGNGPSLHPIISEVNGAIAFDSTATDLPGTLGGSGIYLSSPVNAATPQPPTFTQITWPARFGDCSYPAFSPGSTTTPNHIAFVCTGDPLDNGTTGNRLFVIELSTLTLFQITGAGDVQPPVAMNLGSWFVTLSTTSDLTAEGSCGYQLYFVDFFPGKWDAATQRGQVPGDAIHPNATSVIGARTFDLLPGDTTMGSQIAVTTTGGASSGGVPDDDGQLRLVVGAPDEFTGEASVRLAKKDTKIPPVAVPGIGRACLTVTADGAGTIDCDGGRAGGDIHVTQDHITDDSNPYCLAPDCREDASCPGHVHKGPHRTICPVCIGYDPEHFNDGACSSGPYAGLACTTDEACQGILPCEDGTVPSCNGAVIDDPVGTFAPGGMTLTVPVSLSFSISAGPNDQFCDSDDTYSALKDFPANLLLTTGSATGAILDADAVLGSTLAVLETGAPFDCIRLRAGDLGGARLVGVLPFLDIPNFPALHDVLVSVRLEAKPPPPTCSADPPCASAADCDDGNPCDGAETCVNGACAVGTAVVCDDGNPCNGVETCNPADGTCLPGTPCDDGNPCNGTETCDLVNGCQPGTPIVCSDNDACNGLETCNPADGTCLPGAPPVCDDGNPCTSDACDAATGCTHTNLTGACDDGSACTLNDTCTAGACVGTPVVCSDGDACNGIETCNPADGSCQPGVAPVCNDGNPCTDDGCDPSSGCVHVDNTNPCDDGSLCTTGDTCAAGACVGAAVVCDDGDPCNGAETCNPADGTCQNGPALVCDDGNPCTDDTCDPTLGCVSVPNVAPCDDGNPCTSGDTCAAGTCVGVPVLCDDGDPCNGSETCDPTSGACGAGPPLACDDGNPCTDDSCVPLVGCAFVNNTSPCDDGNLCTTNDTCLGGLCGGTAVACDDGDACNGTETCDPSSGACQAGVPLVCDDGDTCTTDTCDAILGCVFTPTGDPLCLLNNVLLALTTASPTELGGAQMQARLTRTLLAGQIDLQTAVAKPGRARRIYARLYKRLKHFERLLRRGARRGRFSVAVSNRLITLNSTVMGQLLRLENTRP